MTGISLLLLLLVLYLYLGAITWKFFTQAGRKAWEAFIPVYNLFVMIRIIQRPWWWIILALLPVVGNVMLVVMLYELMHVYRYSKIKHILLTIVTAGLYLGYLNYTEKLEYKGRDYEEIRKHVNELTASIIFAVVAATAIRAFTFEAFVIPTPSMEKSLMVGDFLFVSKLHYGSRVPMTPLSLPLVHNKIPGTESPSYTDALKLPYMRLPALQDVQRNQALVFNYPMQEEQPVDKRDHYVKRCIALPGDTLEIVDRKVFINGERSELPERANPQFTYYVQTDGLDFNRKLLKERFDINYLSPTEQRQMQDPGDVRRYPGRQNAYEITISEDALPEFKKLNNVTEVRPLIQDKNLADKLRQPVFPNSPHNDTLTFRWTLDNYGPLYMPQAGDQVELTPENILKFKRIIEVYEGNDLAIRNGKAIINGEEADTYTFQQGYYWAMGDNRHNSLDSRFWGYVPADHVVGKPVFIWMSYDKFKDGLFDKIRTNRVFTTVHGEGEPMSFFWPFVGVVVIIYVVNYYRKRKKGEEA